MPINVSINVLRLFSSIVRRGELIRPIIDMPNPTKPFVRKTYRSTKLDRANPSDLGLDPKIFLDVENDFKTYPDLFVNRFMIVKDDKVVFERYNHPYSKDDWNCCYSFTKSIISFLIGILVDDEVISLDDSVSQILNQSDKSLKTNEDIKIRHLLTMTSGLNFNEASSAVSEYWVKDSLSTMQGSKAGVKFQYNSLNTYLLCYIIKTVTNKTVSAFAKERLFDELGIYDYFFETSPEHVEKGGWGLYLCPEDMAKFGILILNKGKYNNKQIISEKYIDEMCSTQIDNENKIDGMLNYGYHIWVNDSNNSLLFNGLFGQNLLIYKNTGLILVTCSSNNEAFQTCSLYGVANEHLNKLCYDENDNYCIDEPEIYNNTIIERLLHNNLGHYYENEFDSANPLSVLPLILQLTMNTYSTGFKGLEINKEGDDFVLTIQEENDSQKILFNFTSGVTQDLNIYGNIYSINASGHIRKDERDFLYILIKLNFLEFASTRYIKLYFRASGNMVTGVFNENPNESVILDVFNQLESKVNKTIERAINMIGREMVYNKIRNIFMPTFVLTKQRKENK